ncbi:Protein asteroid 1 [Mortierella polycephala]|uniref:Protein asteroid 1 n=1 Tax=Mortierella polycephala TaxID=41804 RepID=A0A9P6TXY8_9FUNG|nr:Protein asteroid 1 [Mortierella polycephala]
MGVLGLYSYFESKSLGQRKSWTTTSSTPSAKSKGSSTENATSTQDAGAGSLTSKSKQRYFILDGNAYIHHLYCGQFEWVWGGQYSSFVSLLVAHITALKACGFKLQFLFDGHLPLQKLQTRLNRDTEKIYKLSRVMGDLEHYHVLGLNNNSNGSTGNTLSAGSEGLEALANNAGGAGGAGSRSSSHFLIPPLTMEVTLQTLRSLGVDLMVCDGEADGPVAQQALEKSLDPDVEEAYAVSKDSDYFIYNTGSMFKGGYIPLDSLFVSKGSQTSSTTISATVYSQAAIAEHLGIQPQFLPLFASLTGNDYVRPDLFEDQISRSFAAATGQKLLGASNTHHARIKATAGFLKQHGASRTTSSQGQGWERVMTVMETILDDREGLYPAESTQRREELRSALLESMRQYSPLVPINPPAFESSIATGSSLSNIAASSSFSTSNVSSSMSPTTGLDRMKEALRSGQFSFKLMDVICNKMFWCTPFLEDTDRESAWLVSRELRRWVYGILAQNLLTEGRDAPERPENALSSSDLDVVEYVRRGDHLSAEIVTGASSLELDEMLKTARAKSQRKAARRISVMDVDLDSVVSPKQQELDVVMDADSAAEEPSGPPQTEEQVVLNQASRTGLFLGILGADTAQVKALPNPFIVLAATLRYLVNALAHSKTRSASVPVANFEVIAFVATALFLYEKYHPEAISSTYNEAQEQQQQHPSIPSTVPAPATSASTSTSTSASPTTSYSPSGSFTLDEAPPLTRRSLHLSTQYQHALGSVSLLANALLLEDMIPPLASLFDGLLFQQTLALARGGTLLEQRMQYPESVQMYHRILAAVEEDFIDTGEIDVVVVFRTSSFNRKQPQYQQDYVALGIFGPDIEPVNQMPASSTATSLSSSSSSSSLGSFKTVKSSGIQKKSAGSSKKRNGGGGGSSSGGRNGSRGGSGANMFNVLSLGCEF